MNTAASAARRGASAGPVCPDALESPRCGDAFRPPARRRAALLPPTGSRPRTGRRGRRLLGTGRRPVIRTSRRLRERPASRRRQHLQTSRQPSRHGDKGSTEWRPDLLLRTDGLRVGAVELDTRAYRLPGSLGPPPRVRTGSASYAWAMLARGKLPPSAVASGYEASDRLRENREGPGPGPLLGSQASSGKDAIHLGQPQRRVGSGVVGYLGVRVTEQMLQQHVRDVGVTGDPAAQEWLGSSGELLKALHW